MDAGKAEGKFVGSNYTNLSTDAIYGQLTQPLADPAMAWARATDALAYVRCCNWLGDGIPKDHPRWFSGCRVARREPDGAVTYHWEALERVLDTLVASGLKPVVVCGAAPDALIAGQVHRNEGGAAVNRPRDYAQYQDMLAQMFRRLEKTYGEKEVRSWLFEAWSQPDDEGSREGGRPAPFAGNASPEKAAPFLELYDRFVAAADSVDRKLRLGGPGIAGDRSFLRLFLQHCTGAPGPRADFITWCGYGAAAQIAARNAELRAMIDRDFPQLKGLPCCMVESADLPFRAGEADTAAEAARLAALVDADARSARPMDLLFRNGDLVDDHFNGSRPLITHLGEHTVPTPAFRLYQMLAKMGGERLKVSSAAGFGALATRKADPGLKNATQVLVYRCDPGGREKDARPVRLRITGLPPGLLQLPMRRYEVSAANAPFEAWAAAGRPTPAPKELGRRLVGESAFPLAAESNGVPLHNGEARLDLDIEPNSVMLITLGAEPLSDAPLCERGKRLRKAEEEMNTAAELDRIGSYERAAEALRRVRSRYADTYWAEAAVQSLVGIYDLDLKSPVDAEATRKELLAMPVDDFTRIRVLERLRVDAVRKGDTRAVTSCTGQLTQLQRRIEEQRHWDRKRYAGE